MVRYGQTKLANSVFMQALHAKFQAHDDISKGVKSLAAHPGVSLTNLADHIIKNSFFRVIANGIASLVLQSPEDGACGIIRGMMDPTAESGTLYGPKNNGWSGAAVPNEPTPVELDSAQHKLLWDRSEEAIGTKFTLA